MKTTTFRSSSWMLMLAGALVAPVTLPAQQTDTAGTRTHVVRAGETLWILAHRYLGNGNRWREILRLNATVIKGPQDVPVGATLRIPGGRAQPAPGARGTDRPSARATPPDPVRPAGSATPPSRAAGRTLFYGRRNAGGLVPPRSPADSSGDTLEAAAAVRAFEAASAPFVTDDAMLAGAGRCVAASDDQTRARAGVSLSERFAVIPPRGAAVDSQARFVLARRGPRLEVGQVVVPTAVVRLATDRRGSASLQAEIVSQFDVVSCDDIVLPLWIPPADARRPAPVENGAQGQVVWVASEAVLPTLQHYLVIDIGSADGLRSGDQVTIHGGSAAREPVAIAAVVRASREAATVLVINQARAAIAPGAPVSVSAKLP